MWEGYILEICFTSLECRLTLKSQGEKKYQNGNNHCNIKADVLF